MSIDRHQMPFRLAPDQMRRLDQAARRRGQSRQAFVEAAVMKEIVEEEDRRRMAKRGSQEEAADVRRDKDVEEFGLGISKALRRSATEVETAPSPSSGQVVVNVGNSGTPATGDLIERLASYIAAGNDFDRDTRLRSMIPLLHASASTDEERKALAARLDEAVAAKVKTTESSAKGALRAARMAFDKFTDILR